MLTIAKTLEKHGVASGSCIRAVANVREKFEHDVDGAIAFVKDVFDLSVLFEEFKAADQFDVAVFTTVQNMVDVAVRNQCNVPDAEQLYFNAVERTKTFMTDPSKRWMFATDASAQRVAAPTRVVQTAGGTAVEVNDAGKIKKGTKGPAAEKLYETHVVNAKEPLNRQQFMELLMKELAMTKAGASTYEYNCRKKFAG